MEQRANTRGHNPDWANRMVRLNDIGRLSSSVSEADLARLLSLRGDEDILDLGCGTGFYTDRIAALTTGAVYALEIIPGMLTHYRERGVPANVHLIQGDMTALPGSEATGDASKSGLEALLPACADVAITIATWHEIDGRLDVPGVARLLRPQGRLIVVDWRKNPTTWEYGPSDEVRFSTAAVSETLSAYFAVKSVEDVGPSMFAVTARLHSSRS